MLLELLILTVVDSACADLENRRNEEEDSFPKHPDVGGVWKVFGKESCGRQGTMKPLQRVQTKIFSSQDVNTDEYNQRGDF